MARQPSARLLACAILATASALVTASDDCYEEASPNLFTNPSWEEGLTGWNMAYPHSITTAQHSDGDYSLMSTAVYPYQLVTQTVNDLVVGTAYEFSVDFNIIVSNVGLVESCTMYLYHDALSYANLVAWKSGTYNLHSSTDWQTLTGTYTATATSALLGFYTICSPYRIPQIVIYLDNAVLRGPAIEVCPTTSELTVALTSSESTPVSTSEPTPTPTGSSSSAPPSSFSASPSSSPTPTPSPEPSSVPPSSYSYSAAPSSSYPASPSSSYSASPSSYSVSSFPASSTPANSFPVPPSSTPTPTPSSIPASSYPLPPSSYLASSSPVSSTPPSGSSSIPVGSYPVPPSSYSSHPAPSNTPSATPSSGPSVNPSSGPSSNPSAGPSYNPGSSLPVPPSSYPASSYPIPSNTPSSTPVASPSSVPTAPYPSYPSSYSYSSIPYPTPTRRPCMSKRRRLVMQQNKVRSNE